MNNTLYIFLDEAGNLDFKETGTKYFIITSLTKFRPFKSYADLYSLKYDVLENDLVDNLEYFHATEDRQEIRNKVFNIISSNLEGCRIDSIIAEKNNLKNELHTAEKLYPEMLSSLLKNILSEELEKEINGVQIFTDTIPVKQAIKTTEKTIKRALKEHFHNIKYRIYHHSSKSNFDLQIADYCCWAIYRKLSKNDERSYSKLKPAIKKEWYL